VPLQELTLSRVLCGAIVAACWLPAIAWASQPDAHAPSLRYDALPMKVAQSMLSLTDVGHGDVVYDLGCGDGDIVIIATRRLGARAVCIGPDTRRIAAIQERARRAGVANRIEFRNEDYRTPSIGNATVVVLRLSAAQNLELRAKLVNELKPGTLVISHEHGMGDWKPVLTAYVRSGGEDRPVHLWIIPTR
jgi:SAM-dependent methyltransferase